MKIKLLILLISIFICKLGYSQSNTGLGTSTPDPSAILDISSLNKGLLLPRLTTAQRNAIVDPARGLLVYDTNLNQLWYFDGNVWKTIPVGNPGVTGNTGPMGASGAIGITGGTGVNGTNGVTGATGISIVGATGPTGTNGTNGLVGATGPTGATGAVGATVNGAVGLTGSTGATGYRGGNPVYTAFNTASLTVNSTTYQQVPGLSQTIDVTGTTAKVFIKTTGNVKTNSGATAGYTEARVAVFIDGVASTLGVQQVDAINNDYWVWFPLPSYTTVQYTSTNWDIVTIENLPTGSHTIEVRVRKVDASSSDAITGSNGYYDNLSIIVVNQ
ncbi:MAG: collagen-like protein [Bacteroidota bacterium]